MPPSRRETSPFLAVTRNFQTDEGNRNNDVEVEGSREKGLKVEKYQARPSGQLPGAASSHACSANQRSSHDPRNTGQLPDSISNFLHDCFQGKKMDCELCARATPRRGARLLRHCLHRLGDTSAPPCEMSHEASTRMKDSSVVAPQDSARQQESHSKQQQTKRCPQHHSKMRKLHNENNEDKNKGFLWAKIK
jgi:hypothetical protein